MFHLPVFVGIDYHQKVVQVCVMDQTRKILLNQAVDNDPEAVFRAVAPFGSNVHAAVEACTGAAEFVEQLIEIPLVRRTRPSRLRRPYEANARQIRLD